MPRSHLKESLQVNSAQPSATVEFTDAARRLNAGFPSCTSSNTKNCPYGQVWLGVQDINSSYIGFQLADNIVNSIRLPFSTFTGFDEIVMLPGLSPVHLAVTVMAPGIRVA